MSWSDEVDLAFARRREQLLAELIRDGTSVVDDLGALASSCAANHPLAYVGAGVGAGACMTITRRSPSEAIPRRRSRLLRTLLATLRVFPLASLVTG